MPSDNKKFSLLDVTSARQEPLAYHSMDNACIPLCPVSFCLWYEGVKELCQMNLCVAHHIK